MTTAGLHIITLFLKFNYAEAITTPHSRKNKIPLTDIHTDDCLLDPYGLVQVLRIGETKCGISPILQKPTHIPLHAII